MIERRSRLRRAMEVELPAPLIVLFALAPYAWMILTPVKPNADLAVFPVRYWPSEATPEH